MRTKRRQIAVACLLACIPLTALTAEEKGGRGPARAPVLRVRISVSRVEKAKEGYSITLSIRHRTPEAAIPPKVHALVFYLRGAKPGEASDLAGRAAVEGDLAVGMASGAGKGFDGASFFSYGANIRGEAEGKKEGAFLWISLPARPEYDLTKQAAIRIPVGGWLLNGISLKGSGRCAIALGTLTFGGPKEMPTFHALSNTVEIEVSF